MHDSFSVDTRSPSKLRSLWIAAVLGALAGHSFLSVAQAQNQATSPALPRLPSLLQDPTHPEVQPRLDVDQDPIPSPDEQGTVPSAAQSSTALIKPGEVQKQREGLYRMHQDVDEVLLTCAVVDEKGRPVTDLGRDSFRIWEDGTPQATTSFLHQDQPVSLGILVDSSGSMLDKRQAVNAAAVTLLRASNPQDSTFIVNFSERAFLDQGFTTDIGALSRGLSRSDPRGTTALYDAVAASADELAHHGKLPKQVLLVITDGADNASRLELEQAIRRVQGLGGPVVYSIGLLFGAEKVEGERAKFALEKLSEETGGIAYFPHSMADVESIAVEVAHDIRDQYTIGYRPTRPSSYSGYRVLRVGANAPRHGKLIVRTRKGYYAKKPTQQNAQTAQSVSPQ